jgi:DNA-binding IclR family transcriptional regulator
MNSKVKTGKSVTSRSLTILDAFDAEHRRLTLSQIARRSGLPLATAHRLVGELEIWGALVRNSIGSYEIGGRIWQLGLLAPVQTELREVALPYMQDLFHVTKDNVQLAIRDGMRSLYIERIAGQRSYPILGKTGARLPLHTTAVGKVLLAYSPEDVIDAALISLTPETTKSIIDKKIMQKQLTSVLKDGYATTRDEMSLGASSIAVPILDWNNNAVAALGIVAQTGTYELTKWLPALRVVSNALSRKLAAGSRFLGNVEPASFMNEKQRDLCLGKCYFK